MFGALPLEQRLVGSVAGCFTMLWWLLGLLRLQRKVLDCRRPEPSALINRVAVWKTGYTLAFNSQRLLAQLDESQGKTRIMEVMVGIFVALGCVVLHSSTARQMRFVCSSPGRCMPHSCTDIGRACKFTAALSLYQLDVYSKASGRCEAWERMVGGFANRSVINGFAD